MPDTKWVRFTETVTTKNQPDDVRHFEKDQVAELAPDQADRWVRRNKAVALSAEEGPKAAKRAARAAKGGDDEDEPKAGAGPADYESWKVEDLHAEAARRDLPGRSGLDKAGLVKLIQKADKAAPAAQPGAPAAAPAAGHGHAK